MTFVIVGGGLAGAKAAEAIREAGSAEPVVLICAEPERPYERPPLSKGYLLGKSAREKAFVHDAAWYAEHGVDLRLGNPATAIDREARTVVLADGQRVGYDRLLLATGSLPRPLEVPGSDLAGVHYLRRIDQADRLRDALVAADNVTVVGAGWIGLEVAAAARHHGAHVTVIEPAPTPLHAVLGPQVGEVFASIHRAHGVDLRTGSGLREILGEDGEVRAVRTTDDDLIPAQVVVVGVGIRPDTALAEAAGLEVDNGVVVDEFLRTSDPHILAAGDVANAWHPALQTRLRVEHWANAQNQGAAAGRLMAGAGEPYARLPYFFTDQYDLSMEYHGFAAPGTTDRVVVRGEPGEKEPWSAFWLAGHRVLAGMNANDWDAADDIKRLVRAGAEVDPGRLADPSTPLADL